MKEVTVNENHMAPYYAECSLKQDTRLKLFCFLSVNLTARHFNNHANIQWPFRDTSDILVVLITERQSFAVAPYGIFSLK